MNKKVFPSRCKYPNCPNLHKNINGYCDEHQLPRKKVKREQQGYDYKWYKFSKSFLRKHQTCAMCGAKATLTDHLIPIQIMIDIYGKNILKEEYYQPLCTACNSRKAIEDKKKIEQYFQQENKQDNNSMG